MMAKFECDGCGRVIEEDPTVFDLPEGFHTLPQTQRIAIVDAMPKCSCKGHMGWMEVGGKAWFDYHEKGIDPMSLINGPVAEYLKRN
jgi:hypothetical protein